MSDDGGPAFPGATGLRNQHGLPIEGAEGMSLRDWFASMALIGILGARNGMLVDVGTDNAPGWAYRAADAMLAARKEPQDA